MFSVYRLVDDEETTFYIGITEDIYKRFKEHLRCDDHNPAKDEKIRDMQKKQVMVRMLVIERASSFEKARWQEALWTAYYMGRGAPLTNIELPIRVQEEGTQLVPPSIKIVKRVEKVPTVQHAGRGRWSRTQKDVVDQVLLYYHRHGNFPSGYTRSLRSYYNVTYIQDKPGNKHAEYLNLVAAYEKERV